MLNGKKILLVISGGIAAYKALELIRLLKKSGAAVRCILTSGGAQFVTPLSVAALSEEQVYDDLWSLKDETEMGHIRLSREADLIVIAPASANIIAKTAQGIADDLATTTLLAANTPVMVCPAMNPMMWNNPATRDNIALLKKRGFILCGPAEGDMACGEVGAGRLIEPPQILESIIAHFQANKPLAGLKAIVTSGPTHEAIDPVRFISNRSSGKQGHAIAKRLSDLGASVTLISGPTGLKDPDGIKTIRIETAAQMLETCEKSLPCDIAVCAAAVADWTPETYRDQKIKKNNDTSISLSLKRNEDILARLSAPSPRRPKLVVGFAAETSDVASAAKAKLERKKCDWLVANPVNSDNPVFGSDQNQVYFLSSGKIEEWPMASKDDVARALADRIADFFRSSRLSEAAE